jgi:ubiquinone/menaquinone biosynthesis C-methylase UbiE
MEDTDYALGRSSAEYDRLIEQAELMRPLTERVFRAAGVERGMRVLDVGCGAGDVSFLVSALVGPEGSVVGVDLDENAVDLAEQRRARMGITNVAFQTGDARSVQHRGLFDAAVGRLVLMFMGDPTASLRLIAEQVRPGGIIALQEWDGRVTPAIAIDQPVLASLQDLMSKTFERSGARVQIGAELYWRMLEAGLEPDPTPLAEFAMHMGEDEVGYRRWASIARSLVPKMVEYGLAAEQDVLDTIEHQLRDELAARRASCRCPG